MIYRIKANRFHYSPYTAYTHKPHFTTTNTPRSRVCTIIHNEW